MRVRLMSAKTLAAILGFLLLTLAVQPARSQDIFGTINGTVTDKTGGVVANAKVTITNEETGISQTIKANDQGYYVAESMPVGHYTITVDQDKFKTAKKTENILVAGGHLTVNVTLEVGATTQTIEVTATGVAINTTSAEISRTVDSKEVTTRALNERNYIELITLVPGAVLTSFDQTTFTTGQSITPGNINGLRADGNLLTVDGGFNMDSGSNATQLNNVGIDFIHEVTVQTSNYSAEYGRSSASSVNVVTNSGGNKYHGTLFEYARNDAFDAKPAFAPKSELRYNDFGGSVGGPIWKKKLYFFGGVETKRLILPGDGPAKTLTLPTTPELIGNFADTGLPLTARGTVTAASGCIGSYSGGASDVNPADFVPNTATGTGSAINPACITSGGRAISNIYKLMETPGASPESANSFTNTAISGNATFAPVTPQNWEEDIVRIDYHPTQNHSDYFRYLHDHLVLIDPFGPFSPGGALPTSPQMRVRPGFSYQVGDVWTISSHLVNEAKFNVSWNKQRIPPFGNLWQQATYGFNSTNVVLPFPGVGPFPTGIPSGTYSGTCPKTACPAEFLGPFEFLLAPTVDISPADNVSWQVGNHTLKFGASFTRNRKDQNSRTDATQGQLNFNFGSAANPVNPNSTGEQFADSLMGNYNSLVQFSADPIGHFRFNDYGIYAQDNWRITPRLSVDFGLRMDYTVPTYTQANNMVNFDPSLYTAIPGLTISSTNIPTAPVSSGLVFDCPPTSTTPGACNPGPAGGGFVVTGLVRPGGVPADQLGRVPNGNTPFVLDVPAGAPRAFYKPQFVFGPRAGIAWAPVGDKTVIRAGAGLYYDKPEGNVIFGQTGVVPFLQQIQFNSGNLASLPASGSAPTVFGTSAINPKLVVAHVFQYSLSVQHEFRGGILFQVAYVGNEARHLLRQPNINVPTFATAAAAPAGTTVNQVRPFLGYADITQFNSDGNSNYNSLQLSASKTKGFATVQVSYTYGRALGDANGLNDNPEPECAFTCVNSAGQTISWKQYDYGRLNFDIRHAFVASYTLTEPWFKDRKGVASVFISGWSLSGITRAQSGFPLTVNGSVAIGGLQNQNFTDRANLNAGVPLTTGIAPCVNNAAKLCYFNPLTAPGTGPFTSVGMNTGIGNAPIGNITGPGYFSWDLALRKNFRLPVESMGFMIELDAFNAFNRINYANPTTSVTSGAFGQISASQPPRQLQLGAKFTF